MSFFSRAARVFVSLQMSMRSTWQRSFPPCWSLVACAAFCSALMMVPFFCLCASVPVWPRSVILPSDEWNCSSTVPAYVTLSVAATPMPAWDAPAMLNRFHVLFGVSAALPKFLVRVAPEFPVIPAEVPVIIVSFPCFVSAFITSAKPCGRVSGAAPKKCLHSVPSLLCTAVIPGVRLAAVSRHVTAPLFVPATVPTTRMYSLTPAAALLAASPGVIVASMMLVSSSLASRALCAMSVASAWLRSVAASVLLFNIAAEHSSAAVRAPKFRPAVSLRSASFAVTARASPAALSSAVPKAHIFCATPLARPSVDAASAFSLRSAKDKATASKDGSAGPHIFFTPLFTKINQTISPPRCPPPCLPSE
ncbi:hypothetical protein, conserved in T.vivax [Trypanosoma vivax Y486]|uniref:Transmembrane protein n=1 Tax=Trypanosoma vivax (strain Y486) TaxID=1055687 RepID=F9WPV6_TRYVY|nr:hypothetical protein, conserved in T.vivax [Trypanosoma vivax Y486]|eukprot:CCD19583.1 hypothetical protein, conserved in T.vivax [Trypanosoma vivax Y486]